MSWKKFARIMIALVAMGAVVTTFVVSHAAEHLTARLLFAIILVQPLNCLSIFLAAGRLNVLSKRTVALWSAAKAQSLTILALYVLPTRASEVIKPLYIADHLQMPLSRALAIVFCERLSDLFIMAGAVLVAAVCLVSGVVKLATLYWIGVTVAVIILCLGIVWQPGIFKKMIDLLPWQRFATLLNRLLSEARNVLDPRLIPRVLCLGAGAWLGSYVMTYLLLQHAGQHLVGPEGTLLVFLAGTAGLIVAVAPAGLGTFEGAIVMALGVYGYTFSEGLALAVALRIASVGPSLLIAIYVLAREKTGIHVLIQRVRGAYREA